MQAVMSWGDNVQGKQFPTFTPMGPFFVSSDAIENPNNLSLQTKVNGVLMQDTNTNDLIFSIEKLISHFSKWYTFLPGDIISTGSPSGVGYGRMPPIFLKNGDIVEISVSSIGTLSNPVI
jgi:2-keto-4-pentenoate hydratase/2-oxohepta-3-ene-1,7-dioic acid hydratase in catechol pathway